MIFSVIIPCYNCVKTLEATVNSIRVCGLSDYEILLIDDGAGSIFGLWILMTRWTKIRLAVF